MNSVMIWWIYEHVLVLGHEAKELTVSVPSIGDPFHGRVILLQEYINRIKDGW